MDHPSTEQKNKSDDMKDRSIEQKKESDDTKDISSSSGCLVPSASPNTRNVEEDNSQRRVPVTAATATATTISSVGRGVSNVPDPPDT